MPKKASPLGNFSLNINQEIHVHAPLETTFEAMLEQLGPENSTHEGKPMPMKLEPWPGGRWFRELGDNNGHFWAVVQAIERPTLLEFSGPLFMSVPVISNVQYRFSEEKGGTLITFHHLAFGSVDKADREGMVKGWAHMNAEMKKRAESKRTGR
jgi:uncharacterized protein YndB with AHSA1/START domain